MWKHTLPSPTVNNRNYGIRNHQQRNARNETTHFGHSRSKQTYSGDCSNAPSALRGRNLPYGARGLRTAFYQPSHLARLSGQGDYSLHSNRRENTLQTLRHRPTTARELSLINHLFVHLTKKNSLIADIIVLFVPVTFVLILDVCSTQKRRLIRL